MIKSEKLEFQGIKYLVYYPKDFSKTSRYPVVFHLHGSGSRGINFEGFKQSTILDILNKGDSPLSNAICVFPQCHEDTWFSIFNPLLELAKYIYNLPFVDKKRFNASGVSMGGYATYQVLMCLPDLFDKAIICCGGGMYWNSGRIKNIKFRIFHGEKDVTVYPEEARRMYARLLEVGSDVELNIFPECDHNCWDRTYSNYDNLDWLIK